MTFMPEINGACLICERVVMGQEGRNLYLICECEHSLFVVGDHQFHRGYALVLLKEHIQELHELAPWVQAALFREVMVATNALVATFHPWKMNHACYGNAEQHVHWRLFPRYDDLPDHWRNPWLHSGEFKNHRIDATAATELASRIRTNLATK